MINLINSLKSNKAGGHDDILPYFLKTSGYIIALLLSLILNCCITAGIFPSKLKLAKAVPVYKKGPTDQLTNYRPISLLPSLSKVFEHMICNRLLSFFTCMDTIVPTQYGFRHNCSTIHAMLDLITTCYDNLNFNKFSALIFLDIQKAFDSVSHQKLVKKLEYYGIRGVANSLICSYLRNRKQYVSIYNKRSSKKLVEYGLPQGSILGPLLFSIYVNDLPSALQTVPRFFADDTALLTAENNVDNLQHLTNSELSKVSNWMLANNLVVSKAKPVALLVFPQTRKSTTSLTLNFDNQIVQPSESAKYLGIFVDEHLSLKPHIIFLEKKIARSVGVLAKLSYYLPCNTLIILYYSLVHTVLIYIMRCHCGVQHIKAI